MPVSPQDFALWSNLTGNPYPRTPAERMAIAPQVHMFNQDLARGKNPLMQAAEGVGKAIDVAGRAALGLGLLTGAAGAGLLAGHYLKSRLSSGEAVVEEPQERVSPSLFLSGFKPKGLLAAAPSPSLLLDDEPEVPPSTGPLQTPSTQRRTTADNYNQDVVNNQTGLAQALRGTSPGKPTVVDSEEKPATQSQVIANSSTFTPGSELEQLATKDVPYTPVRDRADELISEFLGGVSAEQKQQEKIQKGLDVYNAGITGKIERELKPIFKEGRQEGISPIGQGSVRGVEAFRQSPEYAAMMRGAGASMEAEELVGAPGQETVVGVVRPTTETRVVVDQPVEVESPIAAMAAPTAEVVVKQPAAVSASAPSGIEGASPETIALARRTLGHLPLEQAVSLLSGNKGSKVVAAQPVKTRVAEEGRISPNEFLSVMSQQKGPLASYSIEPERSKAVSGMTFYPGGEIGVEMKSRGKPVEYAYATADPYRLTMRDYAEEGFPESMGSVAGIAANQALAHQMGLQKAVEPGGTIRQVRQPAYAGLMSDVDINAAILKGTEKPTKTAKRAMDVAQQHAETKEMLSAFAQKYPQPPMSPEEIARLRAERFASRRPAVS